MAFTRILLMAMMVAAAMAGIGAKVELPPTACGGVRHILLY